MTETANELRASVANYYETGDSTDLQGETAVSAVAEVLRGLPWADIDRGTASHADAEVLVLVARWHWIRFETVGQGWSIDLWRATVFFARAHAIEADLVPLIPRIVLTSIPKVSPTATPDQKREWYGLFLQGLLQGLELTGNATEGAGEHWSLTESQQIRARLLLELAETHWGIFTSSADPEMANSSVAIFRAAEQAATSETEQFGVRVSFASKISHLAESSRAPLFVDEAIGVYLRLLKTTHLRAPARAALSHNLGNLKRLLAQVDVRSSGCPWLIDYRLAVELAQEDDPNFRTYLEAFGAALIEESRSRSCVEILTDAIDVHLELIKYDYGDSQEIKVLVLTQLSDALHRRFELIGDSDEEDVRAAVSVLGEALSLIHGERANRTPLLARLALEAVFLSSNAQNLDVMNQVEKILSEESQFLDVRSEHSHIARKALGLLCMKRFATDPSLENIARAIYIRELALELAPDDRAEEVDCLAELAEAVGSRFQLVENQADLLSAVELLRRAHERGVTPRFRLACTRLGQIMGAGDSRVQERWALDAQIQLAWWALEHEDSKNVDIGRLWGNLGWAMAQRFARFSEPRDLEGLPLLRRCLEVPDLEHEERVRFSLALALLLKERFTLQGDHRDLDEAIEFYRAALAPPVMDSRPDGNSIAATGALAVALAVRFEHFGDSLDLMEATKLNNYLLASPDVSSRDRAGFASNLGSIFLHRSQIEDDAAILDRAIDYGRLALEISEKGAQEDLAMYSANLATHLSRRVDLLEDRSDVQEAVTLNESAVRFSENSPSLVRARYFAGLGTSLSSAYRCLQGAQLLEAAIDATSKAVSLTMPDTLPRAITLFNHASCLLQMAELDPDGNWRERALVALEEVAATENAPAFTRALATVLRTEALASVDLASALAAAEVAVAHVRQAVWRGISRADQERLLAKFNGFGSNAASIALAAGHPEEALELLEESRSLLISQILELSTLDTSDHRIPAELAIKMDNVKVRWVQLNAPSWFS